MAAQHSVAPRCTILSLLALATAALLFLPSPYLVDELPVKDRLPNALAGWIGTEVLFCQNDACQRTVFGTPSSSLELCKACNGRLKQSWSVAETQMLPADTVLLKKLYRKDKLEILATVVVSGSERSGIHRPQMCLIGQGFTIADESSISTKDTSSQITLRHLQIGSHSLPGLVGHYYYWFTDGRHETDSHYRRLVLQSADRLFHGKMSRWAYISFAIAPGAQSPHTDEFEAFTAALHTALSKDTKGSK